VIYNKSSPGRSTPNSEVAKNHVSESHFLPSTGYGNDDLGRDVLESVYAQTFGAEDSHEKPLILLPDSTKQFLVLLVVVFQFFDRFDQFSQPALVLA
jgi:cystathionine beta-lyase family protein involved in aluminum resistance